MVELRQVTKQFGTVSQLNKFRRNVGKSGRGLGRIKNPTTILRKK